MNGNRRFVFDTNSVVSALLFEHSVPAQAFFSALCAGEILLSHTTLAELNDVLGRKKFDRYVSRDEREQFLKMLVRDATVVEISEEIRESRDPKDNMFLALAVNGNAACIVSGDADL